jgi:hypothetical protein
MEPTRRTEVDEENAPLLPAGTKFSWGMLIVLFVYTAVVNGTSELVWPFISRSHPNFEAQDLTDFYSIDQLILSTGIAPDEKSVGFYSGLMVKWV